MSAGKRFHISSSVKSTAGAISTMPAMGAASLWPMSARASSSASQPPMDEPTTTCGPLANSRYTARLSASQRPMVPSVKSPPNSPWPE